MPGAEPTLLFVYGTLRRGGSNDIARIAPGAQFAGVARLRGRLYDVNGRWPALVLDSAAAWVTGELYRIAQHEWPALDALENTVTPHNPNGHYFKVAAPVETANAVTMDVTVYTANPATTRLVDLIASGDWIDHAARLATPAG